MVGTLGTNAAAVGMYPNLPYDPRKDFEPIINMATTPMVVVARKDLPVADFREFARLSEGQRREAQLRLRRRRRTIALDLQLSQ